MMPGAPQLAAELFDIPARKARFGRVLGFEDGFSDLGYSTAIGLVLYDAHRQSNNETKNHHRQASPTRETGLAGRIKNLFDVLF